LAGVADRHVVVVDVPFAMLFAFQQISHVHSSCSNSSVALRGGVLSPAYPFSKRWQSPGVNSCVVPLYEVLICISFPPVGVSSWLRRLAPHAPPEDSSRGQPGRKLARIFAVVCALFSCLPFISRSSGLNLRDRVAGTLGSMRSHEKRSTKLH
jgi:hypothetical protein